MEKIQFREVIDDVIFSFDFCPFSKLSLKQPNRLWWGTWIATSSSSLVTAWAKTTTVAEAERAWWSHFICGSATLIFIFRLRNIPSSTYMQITDYRCWQPEHWAGAGGRFFTGRTFSSFFIFQRATLKLRRYRPEVFYGTSVFLLFLFSSDDRLDIDTVWMGGFSRDERVFLLFSWHVQVFFFESV